MSHGWRWAAQRARPPPISLPPRVRRSLRSRLQAHADQVAGSRSRLPAAFAELMCTLRRDDTPKPVVILLRGSGCGPDFTADPDGSLHEISVFQDAIAATLVVAHVAIIERPGVDPLAFAGGMSMADKRAAFNQASDHCGEEFRANATKVARVDDAVAAVEALSREPWAKRVVLPAITHSKHPLVAPGWLRYSTTSCAGRSTTSARRGRACSGRGAHTLLIGSVR